jgi:hypothetical protein
MLMIPFSVGGDAECVSGKFGVAADAKLLHRYANMCTSAGHDVSHAAGPWAHAFEHRAAVDTGVGDHESADVWGPLIFRVAQGALDQLLQHPRAALRLVAEDCQRIIHRFAANQVGQWAHLAGADPSVPMNCFVCHV